MINAVEAYEDKLTEISKVEKILTDILSKAPKDRSIQDRLDMIYFRKLIMRLDDEKREIMQRPQSVTQQLADKLHVENCNANHTDQCGYYYEQSWSGSEHAKYLDKAKALVDKIGEAEAARLLTLYAKKQGIQKEIKRVVSTIEQLATEIHQPEH